MTDDDDARAEIDKKYEKLLAAATGTDTDSIETENGKEISAKEFYNGFLKKPNYLNTISLKKTLRRKSI